MCLTIPVGRVDQQSANRSPSPFARPQQHRCLRTRRSGPLPSPWQRLKPGRTRSRIPQVPQTLLDYYNTLYHYVRERMTNPPFKVNWIHWDAADTLVVTSQGADPSKPAGLAGKSQTHLWGATCSFLLLVVMPLLLVAMPCVPCSFLLLKK